MPIRLRMLSTWLLFGLLAALAVGANPFRGETSSPVDLLVSYPAWGSAVAKADVRHKQRSDALDARLPQWTFARNEFRQGRLPFWNDTSAGGDAALLKLTSGLVSPAFVVFAAVPSAALGLYLSVLLNLTLAGVGMYYFLRRHVDRLPAGFGAVMFQFSGFITAWLFWPHTLVILWAPWLLLALDALIRSPRPRALAATAGTTAVMLCGGFPFVSLLVLGAAVLYVLVLSVALSSRERFPAPALARFAARSGMAALGIAGGFLLAALPLVVFVDWLSQFDTASRTSGSPLRLASHFSLLFPIAAFDKPQVESAMYVGAAGALLALAGVLTVWVRRQGAAALGWYALLLGLVAVTLTFEVVPRSWLTWVPGLSGNAWSRAISILGLALAISAAVFLHKMGRLLRYQPMLREAPIGVLVVGLLCWQVVDQLRYFRHFNGPTQAAYYYPRTPAIDYVLANKGPFDYVIADNSHLVSGTLGAYGIREWFAHRFRSDPLRTQLAAMVNNPFTTPTASSIRAADIRIDAPELATMNVRYLMVNRRVGIARSLVGVRGDQSMQPLADLPEAGSWVQPFRLRRPFELDLLRIRFATHRATDLDGHVEAVVRTADGRELARSKADASGIGDNEYLTMPFGEGVVLEGGQYVFEVVYRPGPAGRALTAWSGGSDGANGELVGEVAPGRVMDFVLTARSQPQYFRKVFDGPHSAVWENTRSPNGPYFVDRPGAMPDAAGHLVRVADYRPTAFALEYTGTMPGHVVVPMELPRGWHVTIDGMPVVAARAAGVLPAVPVSGPSRIEFRYRPIQAGWLAAWLGALSAAVAGLGWWHRRVAARRMHSLQSVADEGDRGLPPVGR